MSLRDTSLHTLEGIQEVSKTNIFKIQIMKHYKSTNKFTVTNAFPSLVNNNSFTSPNYSEHAWVVNYILCIVSKCLRIIRGVSIAETRKGEPTTPRGDLAKSIADTSSSARHYLWWSSSLTGQMQESFTGANSIFSVFNILLKRSYM